MYPHRIRLVGPWECETLGRRVAMPCRLRDCGLGDFTGTVRFARRFGYPGRIDEYERVWLTFAAVAGRAVACLNGTTLGQCEGTCEFEVTRLLRERNLLQVDIDGSGGDAGLCGEVALEVRRTAFLRNLHVTASDELHVSGEVTGTAEGALELYVVRDRRNVGYAVVEAGKAFDVAVGLEDSTHPTGSVRVDLVQGASTWWTEEKTI